MQELVRRVPRQVLRIMESESRTMSKVVIEVMRTELEPVRYIGTLERSVSAKIDIRAAQTIVKVGPTAEHAAFVRYGTRPHWAPIAPLKAWAAWKLGDENAAYAVQQSIAKHGTSMWAVQLYGGKANDYVTRTLTSARTSSAFREFLRRVQTRIVQEGLRR